MKNSIINITSSFTSTNLLLATGCTFFDCKFVSNNKCSHEDVIIPYFNEVPTNKDFISPNNWSCYVNKCIHYKKNKIIALLYEGK